MDDELISFSLQVTSSVVLKVWFISVRRACTMVSYKIYNFLSNYWKVLSFILASILKYTYKFAWNIFYRILFGFLQQVFFNENPPLCRHIEIVALKEITVLNEITLNLYVSFKTFWSSIIFYCILHVIPAVEPACVSALGIKGKQTHNF